MLIARVFSYPDAQRNRVGTNYNQLPVNAPISPTNSYDKEGQMQYHHSGAAPVYSPNSYGRAYQDEQGVEMLPLIILGVVLVGFGLFPQLLMGVISSGVEPIAPVLEQIADAPTLLGGVR